MKTPSAFKRSSQLLLEIPGQGPVSRCFQTRNQETKENMIKKNLSLISRHLFQQIKLALLPLFITLTQIMAGQGGFILSIIFFFSSLSKESWGGCRYWGCKNPCVSLSDYPDYLEGPDYFDFLHNPDYHEYPDYLIFSKSR